VVFTPSYSQVSNANGSYFTINEETETVAGMPIMPRTSLLLPNKLNEQAHGAFFEGGQYSTLADFDPVISRLVTDTAVSVLEPLYNFSEWMPSSWDLVNGMQMPEGLEQRLVVLPAQYSATSTSKGTLRLFSSMNYTVYYSSNGEDLFAPSIWSIQHEQEGQVLHITAEVTDYSGVGRVAATYSTGDGWWHTVDLSQREVDPNIWSGDIPYSASLFYFIQALDLAGNVGVETNKSLYFDLDMAPVLDQHIFLPLITR
jgi:hypothetical protein